MTPFLTSAFRHLITVLAGVLVHSGWMSQSAGAEATGVLVFLFGLALSWVHKAGVQWQLERLASLQYLARTVGGAALLADRERDAIAREVEARQQDSPPGPPSIVTAAQVMLVTAVLIGVVGCAGTSGSGSEAGAGGASSISSVATPDRVRSITILASFVGFRSYLVHHPEAKPTIERCYATLNDLVARLQWDIPAVTAALAATQIASLPSSEGTLYIGAALALDDIMGPGRIDLKREDHARAFIIGLDYGLGLALDAVDAKVLPGPDDPWADTLRAEAEATRTPQRAEVK